MIVVYVNSMSDTDTFHAIYENLDCKLMINPKRHEVVQALQDNPTETLLAFGHGTPYGLTNAEMDGYVIDYLMEDMLRTREVTGVWCYASMFAQKLGLKGFFTNMFISNPTESLLMGCGNWDKEIMYEQNSKFAHALNKLIRDGVPMDTWPQKLYESCDKHLDFVEFNYSRLAYFGNSSTV